MNGLSVTDLIARLDAEIAQCEGTIAWLEAELVNERERREAIRRESAAVRSALQRVSGEETTGRPLDMSWSALSHVNAVEAALCEAGRSMHLTEIADALETHGHAKLPKAKISATLTHLSQVRGTAVNVGNGRWNYVPPATSEPNLRVVPPDDAEKLPSQGGTPDLAIPVADTGRPIA